MNDLKKGKMIINSETGETTIIPSKEVSYEQYFHYREPFAVKTEIMDEQMIDQIVLKETMQKISEEERELICRLDSPCSKVHLEKLDLEKKLLEAVRMQSLY